MNLVFAIAGSDRSVFSKVGLSRYYLAKRDNGRAVAYLILGLVYKLIMDYAILYPLQKYSGGWYECALDPNFEKWQISMVLAFFMFLVIPKKDGASSLVVQLSLLYIVVPLLSVYALKNGSTAYMLMVSASFLVVEMAVSQIRFPSLEKDSASSFNVNGLILGVLGAVTAVYMGGMLLTQGIPSLAAFDLSGIYEVRSSVQISGLLSSLMSPMAKGVVPFFLALALLQKRYGLALFCLALETAIFLWTGHKSFLFLGCIVFAVILFYRPNRNLLICVLFVLFVAACTFSYWLVLVPGLEIFIWPFSLFVRRALFIPAVLKFSYYDYFERGDNPLNLLGTLFSPFAYGPDPVRGYEYEIGGLYTGSYSTYANTGMYGEEIASFGLVGVVLASAALLAFAVIVEGSASRSGDEYALAIALPFLLNCANASIVKTMLHPYGLMIAALLLVYCFRRSDGVFRQRDRDIGRDRDGSSGGKASRGDEGRVLNGLVD